MIKIRSTAGVAVKSTSESVEESKKQCQECGEFFPEDEIRYNEYSKHDSCGACRSEFEM
jgi:hypothetical protein